MQYLNDIYLGWNFFLAEYQYKQVKSKINKNPEL